MRLNLATVFGILLIAVGAVALVVKGISWTRKEKILDIGPIEATAETEERIAIPTWAAGLILATGVVVVLAGARKSA
jgi:hypothetical protein